MIPDRQAMPELVVSGASAEIPPEIERQIRALLGTAWPASDEEPMSGSLVDPALHPTYFVLTSANVLLAYGRTIRAWVPYNGGALKVYGLGDVITTPERRRSGYGGRIVEAATAHIRSDTDADLAVLLAEPGLEGWYGRHGWIHVPGVRVRTGEYEDARMAGAAPMFLLLSTALGTSPTEIAEHTLVLPGDEW